MKLHKIPHDTTISPLARPQFLEGGDEAVLLIHGFTGITEEFTYMMNRIHEAGYTVSLPRLPGHGTNRFDFHESDWRDWLRKVTDEYLHLKTLYSKVYIAGLSMGGVLTLLLAEKFDPEKIALLAPAMSIRNRKFYWTRFLKYFIRYNPGSWKPSDEESEERIAIGKEYWQQNNLAKVSDLLTLQNMARKNLAHVSSPALTIVSLGDKTVPPEAADIIENGISSPQKKRIILENSPHVLINGCDKETVADEVIAWFKGE